MSVTEIVRRLAGTTARFICALVLAGILHNAATAQVAEEPAASVTTDRLDYPPGDTVWIKGTGFKPNVPPSGGEVVEMSVRHVAKSDFSNGEYDPWTATTDPNGGFASFWVVPYNDSIVGSTLELTATGLTSGLVATTQFTDANVLLTLTTVIPDTICPGDTTLPGRDSLYLCAQLLQGGCELPLAGRTIRFYWNPGNCGVDNDAEGEDTVITDANGLACTDLAIPDASGKWVLRVKFDGEDKPNPCPNPGNSACDPTDPNGSKRCVNLSASNICEGVTIDTIACCTAPICSLGVLTSPGVCTPDSDFVPFTSSDPDDGLDSCVLYGPGELVPGGWVYEPVGGETVNVRIVCTNLCGDSCVTEFERTYSTRVSITCLTPNDTTIIQCDPTQVSLPASAAGATCEMTDNSPGSLVNGNWVYTPSGDETVSVSIRCISTDFCDTCTASFSVTFDVNAPPTITCPPDLAFECDSIGDMGSPDVDDDRDANPTVYVLSRDSIPGNCPDAYTLRLRYVVKDECGDSAHCDQSITVQDSTAPVLDTCDTLIVYECTAFDKDAQSIVPVLPTASDNCDPNPTVGYAYGPSGGTFGCDYFITFKIYATDRCGNVSDTCFQTIRVIDTTPPEIVCPDSAIYECPFQPILVPPPATDNCPGYLVTVDPVAYRVEDSTCYGTYRWVITWEATDRCGNKDLCEQVIRFRDTTPPVFGQGCPSLNYECDEVPTEFPAPIAADLCDPNATVNLVGQRDTVVGDCPQRYSWTLVWEAKDDCGNADSCEQQVHVTDTEAPKITCPPDTVIDCSENDFVNGVSPKALLDSYLSGALKDANGCAPYDFDDWFGSPTGTDNCDDSVEFCLETVVLTKSSPCSSSYTLTFTGRDDCGNQSEPCVQNVTFVDTTGPVLVCAPDTTVYCDDESSCLRGKSAIDKLIDKGICGFRLIDTVYDACDDNVDVYTHLSYHFEKCPQYIRAQIWAVDDCGNISDTCLWTVYFEDTLAPVITCPPNVFAECGEAQGDWGWPTATDDCGDTTVTLVDQDTVATQGNCYIEITRKFVATDSCQNADTCVQTIIVGDSTDPVITCARDTVVSCEADPQGTDWKAQFAAWAALTLPPGHCHDYNDQFGTPTVTDNCSEYQVCLFDVDLVDADTCGTKYALKFEAKDECGNADTCTQYVSFDDKTPPVIVCAPDTTIYCDRDKATCIEVKGTEAFKLTGDEKFLCGFRMIDTVYDGCCEDVEVFVRLTYHLNKCPAFIRAFMWAVDCCGNVSDTCDWILNIADTAAPVITCPNDLRFECSDVQGDWGWATATDNCTEPEVRLFDQDTVSSGCETVITRIFTATDRCKNESRCTQTITVADTTDPICTLPDNDTIFVCNSDTTICLPVSATDNCDQSVECAVVDGAGAVANGMWCYTPTGNGPVTAYIRCVDDCGNACEGNFTITFILNDAPACILPRDTTFYLCDPGEITLPVSATDTNGNWRSCFIINDGKGTLVPGANPGSYNWTYSATVDDKFCVRIRCEDSCNAFCEDEFCVIINITEPPVCYQTPDTAIAPCNPEEVCLPIDWPETSNKSSDVVRPSKGGRGGSRPNSRTPAGPQNKGQLANCNITSGPGEIKNGRWCWTPPDYDTSVTVTIVCTDTCQHSCENEFKVDFDMNVNPVCSIFVQLVDPICTPDTDFVPLGTIDPDGTTECRIAEGPGELVPGGWQNPNPDPGSSAHVVIVCSDTCGDSCVFDFTRNYPERVQVNCTVPEDIDTVLCDPTTLSHPVSGGEGSTCSVISGPGTVEQGNWMYYADHDTSFCVTIRCLSLCDSCEATFCVTVDMNDPPVCELPNDTLIFRCSTGTVCLPIGASDTNGNFSYCAIDYGKSLQYGYVSNGQWCYDYFEDVVVTVPIICYDSCGAYCQDSFTVTIDVNEPPECQLPNDTTIFLCDAGTVCLPIGATDADGNFKECQIDTDPTKGNGHGYIQNGQWCYDVTGDGQVTVPIVCYDSCGAACRGQFTVTFELNSPPTCDEIADTNVFQCEATEICRPVGSKDLDGHEVTCEVISGPGSVGQGQWCWTPTGSGQYSVTIRCTDSCGEYCDESFTVDVNLNDPPECISPPSDTTIYLCEPTVLCIGGFGATDPDGNLAECVVTVGDKSAVIERGTESVLCDFITVNESQTVLFTLRCTDSCGATCTRDVYIHFVVNLPPSIDLGPDISTQVGEGQVCFNYTVSDPDGPEGLTEELILAPAGAVIDTAANTICWTPEEGGNFMFVGKVTDSCGADDYDTAFVLVSQPSPPNCFLPGDTTVQLCESEEICLPVSATSLNPPVNCAVTEGPGAVSDGYWCYAPSQPGEYDVTITCTDNLGGQCNGSFTVTVGINQPPVCSAPSDTTLLLCPSQAASLTLNAYDPDGDITGYQLISGPGSISGNVWSYLPPNENELLIKWRVVDACGKADTCQTRVLISFNDPPTFTIRDDTTITVCSPGPVCRTLNIQDPNNNITSVQVIAGIGTIQQQGNIYSWCFTPTESGKYSSTVRVTDACGVMVTRTFSVTFIMVDDPACNLPPSGSYIFCQSPVCLPIAGNEPPPQRGVTCQIIDGPGYISNGNWCVNIAGQSTFNIVIRCTNTCGDQCQISRSYTFTVDPKDCTGTAGIGPDGLIVTTVRPAGDVNGSGDVNIADLAALTAIVNQTSGKAKPSAIDVTTAAAGYPNYRQYADINCDGRVDQTDLVYLREYLFSSGPVPCDPNEQK